MLLSAALDCEGADLSPRAKKLIVEGGKGLLPVSLDGEVIERKRFTVEVIPGGVNFALPKARE